MYSFEENINFGATTPKKNNIKISLIQSALLLFEYFHQLELHFE